MSSYMRIEPMDLVVYGQVQNAFVEADNPTALLVYYEAVVKAATKRAVSVETEQTPMVTAARQRQEKLEKITTAYGCVSAALVTCQLQAKDEGKNYMTWDKTFSLGTMRVAKGASGQAEYVSVSDVLNSFGISCSQSMKGSELTKLEQTVKLEVDKESSALQQTSSTLKSFISKGDSAYSMIGTLLRKIDGTAMRTIQACGR